ncbi:hypothetical protein MTR67_051822 [Solanum verrucosum]|uniref:Transposase-associated domain-containing protein n=1 Tax=Solanum verrucosum TaxID=315347 RepID=A0AAF0V5Q0_SOLVR|nr:hypothetical protein MTR67_051822 [Solanum verrucosum]
MDHRLWMYNMHYETGAGLKPEFVDGVRDFIEHTMTLDIFKNNGLVRCPCSACGMEPKQYFDEAPNEEARRFYDQLEESSRPLCEGSPHSALRNRPNRNDEGDTDPLFPSLSFFNQNGRGSKKREKRGFTDMEKQSAVTHILLNCPEIQPYVNPLYRIFQLAEELLKEVALGPESQVLTMNKYCINGFKFETEEVSKNKKTNYSGVYIQGDVDGTGQTIEYYGVIHEIIEISSGGDRDRHREYLGVSQTKQAKKKKSKRPINPEDIEGSISSEPERISHDTYLFVVLFGTMDPRQYYPNYRRPVGTSPQLSAMRIRDSSSEQSDDMAGTPPLTQRFVHPDVSPSSTATPSATPDDTMPALALGQKDRLGRVMIEPDGSS